MPRSSTCLAWLPLACTAACNSPPTQLTTSSTSYKRPFTFLFELSRLFHRGAPRTIMTFFETSKRHRLSSKSRSNYYISCLISLLLCTSLTKTAVGQYLSDASVLLVAERLAESANESWEIGTRAQSIIELNAPFYSVLSNIFQPPSPQSAPQPQSPFMPNMTELVPVFNISRTVVANRSVSNGNLTGPQPLMKDGSASDPASIGPAVVLTALLGRGQENGTVDYWGAAYDQIEFLLHQVPRTKDGAISHRVSEVQLWSDFIYMVPPFLAYYGIATKNQSLVYEAYNQIRLYRNHLRDPANNLWKHVVLGSFNDNGYWSTGNGWAAAGMLRVLGTIQNSQYDSMMVDEQTDLASWVHEIHSGMYSKLDPKINLFPNYVGRPISNTSNPPNFYDASSTALLASTVFRLSLLWGVHQHIPNAEQCRLVLFSGTSSFYTTVPFYGTSFSLSSSPIPSPSSNNTGPSGSPPANTTTPPPPPPTPTSSGASNTTATRNSTASVTPTSNQNLTHIDSTGWLHPVVNPINFNQPGSKSPEAQAFVLQLQSAWRDWAADGAKGANGADTARIIGMGPWSICLWWTLTGLVWGLREIF